MNVLLTVLFGSAISSFDQLTVKIGYTILEKFNQILGYNFRYINSGDRLVSLSYVNIIIVCYFNLADKEWNGLNELNETRQHPIWTCRSAYEHAKLFKTLVKFGYQDENKLVEVELKL